MYQLVMKKTLTDESRSAINAAITQFFEEFNPNGSIHLKDGNCRIVVMFEEPPKELIKKMLECNPDEFCYGTSNITYNDGEKQSDSANAGKSEEVQEATDSKDSYESDEETDTDSNDSDEETDTDSNDSDESEEETDTDPNDSDESEEETDTDSNDSDKSEEETDTDPNDSDELEEETDTDSNDSDELEEETDTDSKDSISSEKTECDKTPSTTISKTNKKGPPIRACGEIKMLSELAAKSNSYEEFISLISKEIGFGKNKSLFMKFLNAAAESEEVRLAKISKAIGMTTSKLNNLNAKVSNYFSRKGEKVTLGGFINEVVKYKDYSFNTKTDNSEIKPDESTVVPVKAEQKKSDSKENASSVSEKEEVSGPAGQIVVKHEVPVIPKFEEFLGSIDKTLPIVERVEKVMRYMYPEIDEKIYEQRIIRSYMTAGVSIKKVTHDDIMKKDRYIPPDARMYTSKLVTKFIRENTKGSELVIVADFLQYMQKFILTSDELRKL